MIFYFRSENPCYINSDNNGLHCRQILARELTNLPLFLRYDHVELKYQCSVYKSIPLIEKKCQSAVNYLQPLKLNDTNLIHIIGTINGNNRTHFSDHSQFLDHLRNELLPICGSSRGYKFEIYYFLNGVSSTNIIAQILQLHRIDCCSNVEIKLNVPIMHLMEFPIEPISNWLHQNCNGTNEKSDERFLRICSFNSPFSVLCVRELCDTFKKETLVIFRKFYVIEI